MRSRFGLLLVGALWVASAGGLAAESPEGASLAAARALYAEGLFASAGAELRDLVASGADAETRAAALHLLGRIAVEERLYGEALAHWTDLARSLPGTAAAAAVATERRLVEALVACQGEGATPRTVDAAPATQDESAARSAAAPPAASGPVPPTSPPPTSAEPSAGGFDAAAMAARPEALAAAASPAAPSVARPAPGASPGLVLIAGRGEPYDAAREAIGQLTEFLVERGVEVESPTEGIALVEESSSALDRLLAAARELGAESLLYVQSQFGHRERIEVECYRPDGERLWSEKVTGGTGFSERRMNERLVRRLEEKLATRVGGAGLPVGGAASGAVQR